MKKSRTEFIKEYLGHNFLSNKTRQSIAMRLKLIRQNAHLSMFDVYSRLICYLIQPDLRQNEGKLHPHYIENGEYYLNLDIIQAYCFICKVPLRVILSEKEEELIKLDDDRFKYQQFVDEENAKKHNPYGDLRPTILGELEWSELDPWKP